MSSVSIVIPVYGAEQSLRELHRRLVAVLEPEVEDFEIVFVEDCGGDGSWELIAELAAADDRVRGLRLSRNFGQHSALLCGVRAASKEIVVTMDDDLQNPPEEIPKLLARLDDGYDIVYGTPANRRQHSLFRNLASRITRLALQSVMNAEIARQASEFRAFRTALRDAFGDYRSPSVNLDVLLAWGTSRFAAVEVRHDARQSGASGYTLRKLIVHAANMMTGFSTLPLQFASIAGFVFALFGFVLLAYVLLRYLIDGSSVPGFPFLASIIAIFSGVQLFALGIIGEYLARMHLRTMERPPYVVGDETARAASREPRALRSRVT